MEIEGISKRKSRHYLRFPSCLLRRRSRSGDVASRASADEVCAVNGMEGFALSIGSLDSRVLGCLLLRLYLFSRRTPLRPNSSSSVVSFLFWRSWRYLVETGRKRLDELETSLVYFFRIIRKWRYVGSGRVGVAVCCLKDYTW
jgi:hypothetical protein